MNADGAMYSHKEHQVKSRVEWRANEGASLGYLEIPGRHPGTEIELFGYKPREPTSF